MPKVSTPSGVDLYYVVQGTGPERILFINGLGGTAHLWDNQLEYLKQHPNITACAFDNRGAGFSSIPVGRYTTKLLANDAKELIDHLGWSKVHIVGVSLGGMIAQELAILLDGRVRSLTLQSTYSKFIGVPVGFLAFLWNRNTSITESDDVRGNCLLRVQRLFPEDWRKLPSSQDATKTNEERMTDYFQHRIEQTGFQSTPGRWGQQSAAVTHFCDRRLDTIKKHGYPVLVITGDCDHVLIQPEPSRHLAERLNGRLEVYKNGGHCIYMQDPDWVAERLLETINRCD